MPAHRRITGLGGDNDQNELTAQDAPILRKLPRLLRRLALEARTHAPDTTPDFALASWSSLHCHCGEVASKRLSTALRRAGRHDLADATEAQQDLPGPPETWQRYETDRITVLYTVDQQTLPGHALRGGREAKSADQQTPDHVRDVADYATHALQIFAAPELRLKPPLGLEHPASRLIIRLLDLVDLRGETDPRWDHITLDRDLTLDDARLTLGHEIFHRIQYSYNLATDADQGMYLAMREGGARLAEECIVATANRYIKDGFLDMPARPLIAAPDCKVEPHSYAAGLFWKFLCEQHGTLPSAPNIAVGFDAYVHVLEAMSAPGDKATPYLIADLRRARARMANPGTFDQFLRLPGGSPRDLICTETTWGNFLVANWLHSRSEATSDQRFRYAEQTTDQEWHAVAVSAVIDLATVNGQPTRLQRGSQTPMPPFSASYYWIDFSPDPQKRHLLKIDFQADTRMKDPLVQLVLIGTDGKLADLIRLDTPSFSNTINGNDLSCVLVIVATRDSEGGFTLNIQEASGQPLVSATSWNCGEGTSFETDARAHAWNWSSPDLRAEPQRLSLRLRNRGDVAASAIRVHLAWHKGGPDPLDGTGWSLIGSVECQTLAPAASEWLQVAWPQMPDFAQGFVVRAELDVPGDPNSYDKVLFSGFGPVRLPRFDDTRLPEDVRAGETA